MTKWIKCSDELPLDGQRVILYFFNTGIIPFTPCIASTDFQYKKERRVLFFDGSGKIIGTSDEISYWLPLPEPPEEYRV